MPPLPAGTLTFLFTDIEGSTQRWEHQREAMADALPHHDELLRSAIERHGGFVFKTTGDGLCAAFANADDALAAAISAQIAVAGQDWSAFGSAFAKLSVRMALHTGRAEMRNEDYFGAALSRTARLMAMARGGQVLLSLATQQLVRDVLPPQVSLRDWGEHHLRDLRHTEHIFQVVAPRVPDVPPQAEPTPARADLADHTTRQVPSYLDFDLEIEPADGRYRAQVVQSPAGQPAQLFDLPFDMDTLTGFQPRLATARSGRRRNVAGRPEQAAALSAEEIGSRLFQSVFGGEVLACWRSSVSQADDRDRGLRIRLRFTDAPWLALVPWEYLYDPEFERFVCLSNATPLVRFLNLAQTVRPLTVAPPLNILVMVANPDEDRPLAVEREWEKLQVALGDLAQAGLVRLDRLESATLPALRRRLRQGTYHVFHYIGHGHFDAETGDGLLQMTDAEGRSQPTPAGDIAIHLHNHRSLRLAVLNTCEGARGARDNLFAGTAQTLVRQGIPAVVAMQFEISDEAAIVLASEFYASIADNYPVDAALTQARTAVHDERLGVEWGTPVLYMRATDGRIFDLPQSGQGPAAIAPASPPAGVAPVSATAAPSDGEPPAPGPVAGRPPPVPEAQAMLPTRPVAPPLITPFIGRTVELQALEAALAERGSLVLTGMTGAGKSAVAATLARQVSDLNRVFWHRFGPQEGLEAIVWRLAAFLAHHGETRLWSVLEGARVSGGEPPPPATILDAVLELARGRGFLIAVDDFHLVERDPQIESLAVRLREAVQPGELRLILVTERRLRFTLEHTPLIALPGFSLDDTRLWVAAAGLALPDAQIRQLHVATEGTAKFLILALEALKRARDPAALLDRLAAVDDLEGYLLDTVYERLDENERTVMQAVAVLVGQPGERGVIEAMLAGAIPPVVLRRALHGLADRFLLSVQAGPDGVEEYDQHVLIQTFLYGLAPEAQRQAMHARAAEYYEAAASSLMAARHFQRAGQDDRAASLVLRDYGPLINTGDARELKALLELFSPGRLDALTWTDLRIHRGMLCALLGDHEVARTSFQQALSHLEQVDVTGDAALRGQVGLLRARACCEMGRSVQYAAPHEALGWFDRGLAALGALGASVEVPADGPGGEPAALVAAALFLYAGSVHMALADLDAAQVALERCEAHLPPEPSQLRAGMLLNLASVHGRRGDLARAKSFTREGLAVCDRLADDFRRIELLNNLALILDLQGDWSDARSQYAEAGRLAERIGDLARLAKVALNLGILATNQGDDAAAEAELGRCLAAARSGGYTVVLIAGLSSLADYFLRRGQADAAEPLVAEAERLASDIAARGQMAELERAKAQVALARGDLAGAEATLAQSLALSRELEQAGEEGRSLRVQGELLAARGDRTAMGAAFERSGALLADQEMYEAARTKLVWAEALAAGGDGTSDADALAQAGALAREARLVFRGLGAQRDEVMAEAVMRLVEQRE